MSLLNKVSGKGPLTMKFFGNWEEAISVLNRLSPSIKAASLEAQLEILEKLRKIVRKHIRNQDLTWRPLNVNYATKKSIHGLSGKILIGWGNYYNSIEVWKQGSSGFAYLGVKKGKYTRTVTGKRSKYDIATIAAINEFGGKTVPARPLWKESIKEVGGAHGIRDEFTSILHRKLRNKGIPVELFTRNRIFTSKKWS